jgi:DNA-directed RNA polymerase subunit RPC12/RpoP
MKTLYVWCFRCDKVTEHERKHRGIIRCAVCKETRLERVNPKVPNIFGAKGRGF